jgi:thiosulfate/3-mercaptopyruvate sulfurtransferase
MRSLELFLIAFALILLPSTTGTAATPRDSLLVSTAWLGQHLNDTDLVLLHVGDKTEYDARHIPGGRYVQLRDISVSGEEAGGLTLEMPPAPALRERLAALGVSDGSHVVVYYSSGQNLVQTATRVIFTLVYAGLERVSMLDGGMTAWTKDGHDVTGVVPPARTGTLSALKEKPLIVDAAFVQAHVKSPNFAVVDSRATVFYSGAQEGGPQDHRKAGHIAGAHSVPFTEITNEDFKVKSADELAAVFTKAGVQPGDTVITYCHIGQQATATLFGAMTLGHPVLLYDGSFEDWARRELPIENPSKKN